MSPAKAAWRAALVAGACVSLWLLWRLTALEDAEWALWRHYSPMAALVNLALSSLILAGTYVLSALDDARERIARVALVGGSLMFAVGALEMPVLLILLVRVGIATADGLRSKRRYAIVICFVIAAVLAPPDVVSQIALAVPLLLFYEISILIGGVIERKRSAAEKAAEEAERKAEEAAKAGEGSGS